MNTGTFAGRLGRNADLRQGDQPSKSVCNFSVAVNVGWGDKKRTLWVGCAIWGERAEKLAQYLTKGTAVAVSGDVDLRQYEKKDGTAGAEITCNVQRLTLQGGGEEREDEQAKPVKTPQQEKREKTALEAGADFEPDTEIPF